MEKTPINGQPSAAPAAEQGFGFNGKLVKDMTDVELQNADQVFQQQHLTAMNMVKRGLDAMQVAVAMNNVVRYELQRRAAGLVIAQALPTAATHLAEHARLSLNGKTSGSA